MFLELSILLIGLGAWLLYRKLNELKNYWPNLGVEYVQIKSSFVQFILGKQSFLETDMQIYAETKKYKIAGFIELMSPNMYLADVEVIKNIMIKDFDHFVNRRGFTLEKNDPHWSLNLFNQRGEPWKNLRSKMTPTFTTGKIKRMYHIFDTSAIQLVNLIRVKSQTNSTLDLHPCLQKCTMDIIAKTAFGLETSLYEESAETSEFSKMGQKIQDQFAGRNLFKIVFIFVAPKLASFLGFKVTDNSADKFMTRIITQTLEHRVKTGQKREDFLQLMLEAREESNSKNVDDVKVDFSDDLIVAQSLLFILAGFDTTEAALVWATYELAMNQDIQEKLYQSIDSAVQNNGGVFDYDVINSLDYLDMYFSETLRKYPVGVRLERQAIKPYKIPGHDVTLPVGAVVSIPIMGLHHDPDLWPEPSKFDPLRFTKENVAERHSSAYLPFGQGPRHCIANRFVMTECKAIIAQLVHNFKFEPSEKTKNPPEFANVFGIKPKDGLWLKITARN